MAVIHILYQMFGGDYGAIDKWLMTSNENLCGDVPIDKIRDGDGLVILEYVRDVFERGRQKVHGGMG